jgi:hypothetical protein
MQGLRIILDKSVVHGLNNAEADSLDRHFFVVVPPVLADEILAELAKEAEDTKAIRRIAANSYRVSGNRGLTVDYRTLLANSLLGNEVPMDGRFVPAGERTVKTEKGSYAAVVETPLEDATIAKWERGEFTDAQRIWARKFRRRTERTLNFKLYTDNIAKAGLHFSPPETDEELIDIVNGLLANRKLLPRLFVILAREFRIPLHSQMQTLKRWNREGRKSFDEFAPYAFFCLRANFLWNLSLTNPRLFKPDKNDRRDLEYCYYLPHTEIFSSRDNKHKRLVPALLRPDQSFADGDELKKDLRRIAEEWEKLTKEERIKLKRERGDAPPEIESSLVYKLWKKHDGELPKPTPIEILDAKLVDSSLPKEKQVTFTLREFLMAKKKELDAAHEISDSELKALHSLHKGQDPTTMGVFKTKISRARLLKLYPWLKEEDLDES